MIEGQQGRSGDIFQDTQNNLKLRGFLPPPTHRLDQDGNHITVPKWDEIERKRIKLDELKKSK